MAAPHTITLYDLVLKSGITLSPFVWRTKLALLHKGFVIDDVETSYMGIRRILDGSQRRLPVIDDNGTIVPDSWDIAEYLDRTYPDRPQLYRNQAEKNFARFLDGWMWRGIIHSWFSCYTLDQVKLVHDEDRDYVLDAHQNRIFKRPLEEVVADREQRLLEYRPTLDPLRDLLSRSKWLAGDEPDQIDYIVLGNFLWAASLASHPPLAKDDPLMDWLDRGFDLFGGIGRDPRLYPLAA
jgi:glutathione S-transferase